MKDKEFITLCKALELKPYDGVILHKYVDMEKEVVLALAEYPKYDPDTGVGYLKSVKGNVILASEIATLERNRSLKGSAREK